jgi:hypothetical protein
MNGILDAAVEVDRRLQQVGLRYCLIGGIALQRWGRPRMTLDVDVTVMTQFGQERAVIQQIVPLFQPRIPDAAEFAEQSRVLLLKTDQDVGVDISLGALPFESRMIDRSSIWTLDEQRALRTCSSADLIIQKVFAGRPQDWLDVEQIIERQAAALPLELILDELQPLLQLKDDPQSFQRVQQLLNAV